MLGDLLRRQAALEKTLAKFRGRAIDWHTVDCVRMLRAHLINMGHAPPPLPAYRSQAGAVRAARQAGGLEAVLDGLLERIAPARMLLADVALLEGDGLDAVMLSAGHKLLGWHQDAETLVSVTALELKGAWRV